VPGLPSRPGSLRSMPPRREGAELRWRCSAARGRPHPLRRYLPTPIAFISSPRLLLPSSCLRGGPAWWGELGLREGSAAPLPAGKMSVELNTWPISARPPRQQRSPVPSPRREHREPRAQPLSNLLFIFSIPFSSGQAESPKESSEPTGSPAPVIQHSSVTASPNGLSVRSAAEAVATSVLTQMASQRTELGLPIPSHVIMAPQSQSAGRWWHSPCRGRGATHGLTAAETEHNRGPDESGPVRIFISSFFCFLIFQAS